MLIARRDLPVQVLLEVLIPICASQSVQESLTSVYLILVWLALEGAFILGLKVFELVPPCERLAFKMFMHRILQFLFELRLLLEL
jgi:hypothetical protein